MKSILILLSSLLIGNILSAQTGWVPQESNVSTNLNSVFFHDANNGWIVGDNGLILKTTNHGKIWLIKETEATSKLTQITFINQKIGWIVGQYKKKSYYDHDYSFVLKTIDGGLNWDTLTKFNDKIINKLKFTDDKHLWFLGASQNLIYSRDGGKTIITDTFKFNYNLNNVAIINDSTIYALTGFCTTNYNYGRFYQSTDSGRTWKENQLNDCFLEYVVDTLRNKLILCGNDKLYYSIDDGKTWNTYYEFSYNFDSYVNKQIYVSKNKDIWVTGTENNLLRLMHNSSNLITIKNEDKIIDFNSIFFSDDLHGWLVGTNGAVYYIATGGDMMKADFQYDKQEGIRPFEVKFTDKTNGEPTGWLWSFGDGGTSREKNPTHKYYYTGNFQVNLLVTDGYSISQTNKSIISADDKIEWYKRGELNSDGFNDKVIFLDSLVGYYLETSGSFVMKTTNGGSSWDTCFYVVNRIKQSYLSNIFFIDRYRGWLSGYNGMFFRTSDGGLSWDSLKFPIKTRYDGIEDMYFLNKKTGFAVGRIDSNKITAILKTTDGGQTWDTAIARNAWQGTFSSIFFIDSLNGWVAGHNWLMATTNSGDSWELHEDKLTFDKIKFVNSKIGYGYYQSLLFVTFDGGRYWTNLNKINNCYYTNNFFLEKNGTIWVTSNCGFLQRSTDRGNTWQIILNNKMEGIQHLLFFDNNLIYAFTANGIIYQSRPGFLTEIRQDEEISTLSKSLSNSFPNPFSEATVIRYTLKETGRTSIKIYNSLGIEIETLINEIQNEGEHSIIFNANKYTNGVYFYHIITDYEKITGSLIKTN